MAKTHIKLWFIMLFLAALVVPVLLSPQMARARLMSEYNSAATIFGAKRVDAITERANHVFEVVANGTGLTRLIDSGFVRYEDTQNMMIGKKATQDMSSFTNDYLQTLLLQLYGVFFRGSLMLQWMVYVGIFLFASIFDGVMQRRVKTETLRMNAPIQFAITLHMVIGMLFAPIAYLLLPFAVTPWFMPMWTLIIAFPLAKAIANAAKTG